MNAEGLSGDLIFVNGIEFIGFHGILPEEKREGRRYRVDLVVSWPMDLASRSDRIADTIDYRNLTRLVLARGTGDRCNLVERLAVLIAEDVLAQTRAQACAVSLWKFPPDVEADSVAIRVVRRRPSEGSQPLQSR